MALVDSLARIKELTFKVFSGNSGNTSILSGLRIFTFTKVDKSQHLHFHIDQEGYKKSISSGKIKELPLAVQKYIAEGGNYAFITPKNIKNVEKIASVVKDQSKANLIGFINKVIPRQDRGLWISGLALRGLNNREEVKKIKSDMRDAAGHRGRNIANLCSSEYLESKIMPLYKTLSGLPNGEETFLSSYERIVNYPVFAVFVGENQLRDEILEEVRTKINMLLQDHDQNQIDIHGMNRINVNKIKEILQIILGEYGSRILTHSVHGSDSFIKVQIFLKHK